MTVREFVYSVDVSGEFLRRTPNVRTLIDALLAVQVRDSVLRGPRGGLYEPIGDLYGFDVGYRGLESDIKTYVAYIKARYVRPKR